MASPSTQFNSVTKSSQLDQLVMLVSGKIAAGEAIDLAAITADCPEQREQLEMLLPTLQAIAELGHPIVPGEVPELQRNQSQPKRSISGALGDFRIIREIGRGGMGVVYEAEQISLKRRVAVKVLPFAAVLDPRQLARFKHEAQAAAMLKHPNIVPVHAVGCDRGVHYYAMELVDGWGLDRVGKEQDDASDKSGDKWQEAAVAVADTAPIAALSTLVTANPRERFREIARLGIQAAEALQYAHEMGIVHRDIKPSNLLVDARGHLWITDFGLATTQTDAGLTMTGDLLGTLRYMSPEQSAGDRPRIDYRTDIYSLGITLYELLAGQPAFPDTDRKILFRRIIEDEPKPLRSMDAAIPRDLETIVLKATEKEPHARYESAAELAADLRRFCEEKPIRARRTSRVERLWRWGKRNRLVAALTITVATLVTLAGITAPMIAWRQARLIDQTRQQLYAKDVAIAYRDWNDGDLGHARVLLDRYAPGSEFAHFRDFSWNYLNGLYERATAGFMPGGRIDLSLSANLLAVARSDDLIHLFDVRSWNEVATIAWKCQFLHGFCMSPDGRFLAASYGSTLLVWDVRARRQLYKIRVGSEPGDDYCPCFSSDGSVLATGGPECVVKLWDPTTGKLLRVLSGHRDDVSAIAFSPDGKTLATASYDNSLRFWDTETWLPRTVVEDAFTARVRGLKYDPTGTHLAAGGWGKEISIWDASGQRFATLPASGSSLCFSTDGRLLAVGGGWRGTVEVWNVEEAKLVNDYRIGNGSVAVAFLPDDELLLESEGTLMRRNPVERAQPAASHDSQPLSESVAIAVSAAGDLMVAAYGRYEADPGEGAVVCWDIGQGRQRQLPGHDGSSVFDVTIDATGELIIAGGGPQHGPGFVNLWNARTSAIVTRLPKEETCVYNLAVTAAGDRLAVIASGRVEVWAIFPISQSSLWSRSAARASRIEFSPDGVLLAVGWFGGDAKQGNPAVMIWNSETGEDLATASYDRAITDLAISPNGRYVASIDWFGKIEVYDRLRHTNVLSERAHHLAGMSVAFSPDGQTLVTASSSGDIKLWHVPTMMHVTTLESRGSVADLKFFPDGKTLAVGCFDRTIELWHVDQEKEVLRIDGDVESQ